MGAATARAAGFPTSPVRRCAPDAVPAGTVCLEYEASVWRVPNPTTTNAILVRRIQLGTATRVDLTAGGATQLGTASDDYAPYAHNGQNCANDIYAVSLASEIPSAFVTWFQAQEACANAGKRLPTSAEWQVGANGTPDPGPDDHTTTRNSDGDEGASLTGSRSGCVSARGAFDMVGNLADIPGNALETPWPEGQDTVLMSYLLSAITEEGISTCIQQAFRALKPGGRLILHDFIVRDDRGGPLSAALWFIPNLLTPGTISLTPGWLSNLVRDSGFTDSGVDNLIGHHHQTPPRQKTRLVQMSEAHDALRTALASGTSLSSTPGTRKGAGDEQRFRRGIV